MTTSKWLGALALCAFAVGAQAQSTAPYPNKPIKLVIGFAPGGAADHVARSMSDAFGRALGASVVVENRAGAGSSIAAVRTTVAEPHAAWTPNAVTVLQYTHTFTMKSVVCQ